VPKGANRVREEVGERLLFIHKNSPWNAEIEQVGAFSKPFESLPATKAGYAGAAVAAVAVVAVAVVAAGDGRTGHVMI
jgi:hypothetical protein